MLAHIYNAQGRSYPAKIASDIDASKLSRKTRHAIEQVVLRKLRKLEKDGLVRRQLEPGDPEQLGRALRNYCLLSKAGEDLRREALTRLINIPGVMAQIGADEMSDSKSSTKPSTKPSAQTDSST